MIIEHNNYAQHNDNHYVGITMRFKKVQSILLVVGYAFIYLFKFKKKRSF